MLQGNLHALNVLKETNMQSDQQPLNESGLASYIS